MSTHVLPTPNLSRPGRCWLGLRAWGRQVPRAARLQAQLSSRAGGQFTLGPQELNGTGAARSNGVPPALDELAESSSSVARSWEARGDVPPRFQPAAEQPATGPPRRAAGNGEAAAPEPVEPAQQQREEDEEAEALPEKELLRRQRISLANKGKTVWNVGKTHSPETLERIRAGTLKAMQRPEVRAKIRAARAPRISQSEEVKAQIGRTLQRQRRTIREQCQLILQKMADSGDPVVEAAAQQPRALAHLTGYVWSVLHNEREQLAAKWDADPALRQQLVALLVARREAKQAALRKRQRTPSTAQRVGRTVKLFHKLEEALGKLARAEAALERLEGLKPVLAADPEAAARAEEAEQQALGIAAHLRQQIRTLAAKLGPLAAHLDVPASFVPLLPDQPAGDGTGAQQQRRRQQQQQQQDGAQAGQQLLQQPGEEEELGEEGDEQQAGAPGAVTLSTASATTASVLVLEAGEQLQQLGGAHAGDLSAAPAPAEQAAPVHQQLQQRQPPPQSRQPDTAGAAPTAAATANGAEMALGAEEQPTTAATKAAAAQAGRGRKRGRRQRRAGSAKAAAAASSSSPTAAEQAESMQQDHGQQQP